MQSGERELKDVEPPDEPGQMPKECGKDECAEVPSEEPWMIRR